MDLKTYLDNELVYKYTESQLADLMRDQSIESPLSIKHEYLYNKIIFHNNNVELSAQNDSKRL